jgi:hypothetical protein
MTAIDTLPEFGPPNVARFRSPNRSDPVIGRTGSYGRETRGERLWPLTTPTEIPAVYPEQMAMALALFRAAALDETVEEAILPLSDPGIWTALLEPDAMQRGIGVIRIILNPATVFIQWCKESSGFSNC